MIATVRLNAQQLELAERVVAARWPGRTLADGLAAALLELPPGAGAPPPEAPAAGARARAPDRGPARAGVLVEPGAGCGAMLRRGDVLRVLQVGPGQGVDLIAYDAHDLGARFSAARTRMRCGARPGVGAALWSGAPGERPLLRIVSARGGPHDLLFPACSRFEYADAGGFGHHTNCFDVQAHVVAQWGLGAGDVPDPLNLWLPAWADSDGKLACAPTTARTGDHVDLRAERDVLVVVNPCGDDVFGSGRWELQPVRVLAWARDHDPALVVRRRFSAPAIHELEVELAPDARDRLQAQLRDGWLGAEPGEVLRAAFFTLWRLGLR